MKEKKDKFISITVAAELTPYSGEYLSLRARQGQLKAKKIGRNWFTTAEWVREYLARQVSANVANLSRKGIVIRTAAALPDIDFDYDSFARSDPSFVEGDAAAGRYGGLPSESLEDPVMRLRKNVELFHHIRSHEEEERPHAGEPTDVQFEKFFERFVASLDRHTESHLGLFRNGINWFKRESSAILRSKKKFFIASFILFSFAVIPAFAALGKFDDAVWYAYQKVRDADTLRGHTPGYSANQVLLLDKEGKISIIGHIETEGQLRSFIADGVAPIVVDSTTKVENLNSDYLDGFSSGDFTLAFITKNGNITHEDVFLEGRVEIGKTLTVKGAVKLLSSLEISGEVRALADVFLAQNLSVKGVANLTTLAADFITARLINARVIRGDSVTAIALESTDTFLAKNATVNGQAIFNGMAFFNEGLVGTYGVFQKGLDVAGNMNVAGKTIKLGTIGDSNIALNSQEWNIQKNGIAEFASTTVNGLLSVTGSGTSTVDANLKLTNLEILGSCIGCGGGASAGGWTDDGSVVRLTTASDFVGIGTTSPFAKFSVVGAGTTTDFSFLIADSASTTIFSVQDNGRVGIGTTSPSATLSVAGNILGSGIFALTGSGTSTLGGGVRILGALDIAGVNASSTFANGITLSGGCFAQNGACLGGSNFTGSGSANFIAKFTGPTALGNSSIFDDGLVVGIGTTSPYAKLSVVGQVVAEYFTATSTTATSTFSGGFTAGNNAAFSVNQAATANSLYIAANGNVGIGTSSPSAFFAVGGDVLAGIGSASKVTLNSGTIAMSVISTTTVPASPFAWNISTSTNQTPIFSIDASSSRVIIGGYADSSDLGESLFVRGLRLAGTVNGCCNLYLNNGTMQFAAAGSVVAASGVSFIRSGGTPILSLRGDSGNLSGFVGIGTTTPLTRLSVYGSTTIQTYENVPTAFRILNAATTSVFTVDTVNGSTSIAGATNVGGALIADGTLASRSGTSSLVNLDLSGNLSVRGSATTTFNQPIAHGSGNLIVARGGTGNVLLNPYGGNVGIGTTSPQMLLSLQKLANSTNFFGIYGFDNDTVGGVITEFIDENNTLQFGHRVFGSGEIATVVGASTTPGAKLTVHVVNNIPVFGVGGYDNDSSYNVAYFIDENGLTDFVIQKKGAADSLANIGIGTSSPGSLLSVGNTSGINFSTATSTFSTTGGIVLSNGCFATPTGCLVSGGGAQQVTGWTDDGSVVRLTTASDFVGVGTTTPLTRLSVYGSTTIQTWQNVPTAFQILNAATTSVFTVDTVNGSTSIAGLLNVGGAGTSTINSNLHVQGTLQVGNGSLWLSSNWLTSDGTFTIANKNSTSNDIILDAGRNVGIGTTSPYAKLSVAGDIYFDSNIVTFSSSTASDIIFNYQKSATSTIPQLVNAWSVGTTTATNNQPIFSIDGTNGRVGIGTAGPGYALHVNDRQPASTAREAAFFTVNGATAQNVYTVAGFNVAGSGTQSPRIVLYSNGANMMNLGIDANRNGLIDLTTSTAQQLRFRIGASEKMRIDNVGNIGIGTTSPYAKLSVHATSTEMQPLFAVTKSSGSATTTHLFVDTNGLVGIGTSTPWGLLSVNPDALAAGMPQFVVGSSTQTNFVITNTGNVGIGTTSPRSLLAVHGVSTRASDPLLRLTADSNGTGNIITASSPSGSALLELRQDGTFLIRSDAPGGGSSFFAFNGGAGSISMLSGQTLNSAIDRITVAPFSVANSSGIMGLLNISVPDSTTGTGGWTGLRVNRTGSGSGSGEKRLIDLQLSGVSQFIVNNIGNVGIGTTTPWARLTVNGTSTSQAMFIYGSSSIQTWQNVPTAFQILNAATSTVFVVDTANTRVGVGTSTPFGALSVNHAGGEVGLVIGSSTATSFIVDASGRVGIGTAVPTQKLTVAGNSLLTGVSRQNYLDTNNFSGLDTGGVMGLVGNSEVFIAFDSTNDESDIDFSIGHNAATLSGMTKLFTIINSGHTGIGTTTPFGALSVNHAGGEVGFVIGSSTATSFIVDKNGNVGIGTAVPTKAIELGAGKALTFTDSADVRGITGISRGYSFNLMTSENLNLNIQRGFSNDLGGGFIEFDGVVDAIGIIGGNSMPVWIAANRGVGGVTKGIFIASNNNVGIGTSTPLSLLSVYGSTTIQTWENVPTAFQILNAATSTAFVVDTANTRVGVGTSTPFGALSVNHAGGEVGFVIGSSTQTSFIVDQYGKVGIGTTTPKLLLTVGNDSVLGDVAQFENSTGSCYINPNTTSLICNSDARLKTNIAPLSAEKGLDALMQLNSVTYNWLNEPADSSTHTGFVAQEVQSIFPDLVSQGPDGYYTMNYGGLTPYLVKSVQELNEKINALNTSAVAASSPGAIDTADDYGVLRGIQSVLSQNGTWSIGDDGTLRAVRVITEELVADNIKARFVEAERVKAREVEADEFRIFRPAQAEEASVGEGRILRGEIETTIYSSRVASTSKIFVSFTSDLQGHSYFIDKSSLIETGLQVGAQSAFTVKISAPLPDDATFDWWAVNITTDNQQSTTDNSDVGGAGISAEVLEQPTSINEEPPPPAESNELPSEETVSATSTELVSELAPTIAESQPPQVALPAPDSAIASTTAAE